MSGRLKSTGLRIAQALPVVAGVVIVSFLLTRALPGDPAVFFAGAAADETSIAQIREALVWTAPCRSSSCTTSVTLRAAIWANR